MGKVDVLHMDLKVVLKQPLEFIDVDLPKPEGVSKRRWREACSQALKNLMDEVNGERERK
jgi:hypothetical protein